MNPPGAPVELAPPASTSSVQTGESRSEHERGRPVLDLAAEHRGRSSQGKYHNCQVDGQVDHLAQTWEPRALMVCRLHEPSLRV